jgi:hypothetical protein
MLTVYLGSGGRRGEMRRVCGGGRRRGSIEIWLSLMRMAKGNEFGLLEGLGGRKREEMWEENFHVMFTRGKKRKR